MATTTRRPTVQEWQAVKEQIWKSYVEDGLELSKVQEELARENAIFYQATPRMFKSRIKTWHFDQKTIREDDWRYMAQEHTRRQVEESKDTVFFIERPGQHKKKCNKDIQTYLRRRGSTLKGMTIADFLKVPSDPADFPHIRARTPPLSPGLTSGTESSPGTIPSPSAVSCGTVPSRVYTPHSAHSSWLGNDQYTLQSTTPKESLEPYNTFPGTVTAAPRSQYSVRTPSQPGEESRSSLLRVPSLINHPSDNVPKIPTAYTPSLEKKMVVQGAHGAAQAALEPEKYTLDYRDQESRPMLCDYHSPRSEYGGPYSSGVISHTTDFDLESELPDRDRQLEEENGVENLGFLWASRYFLACILWNRDDEGNAKLCIQSAINIFQRMLDSECRPHAGPRSSRGGQSILSGLTLMTSVMTSHGQGSLLKLFLRDSSEALNHRFPNEDHPLRVLYHYVRMMNEEGEEGIRARQQDHTVSLERACKQIKLLWEGDHNSIIPAYYYGWELLRRQRFEEAQKTLGECLHLAERTFGELHMITINCMATKARATDEQGKPQEAVLLYERACARAGKGYIVNYEGQSVDHPYRLRMIKRLGLVYRRIKQYVKAESKLREVVQGQIQIFGLNNGQTWHTIQQIYSLLAEQGRTTEADHYWEACRQQWLAEQEEFGSITYLRKLPMAAAVF